MGAAAPVAPTALLHDDENLARAKALGILQVHDIDRMWAVFSRWDRENHGKIDLNDYWQGILDEERTTLGDELLKLLKIDEDEKIDFGQFVLITTTYCLFEVTEVLQFCFFIFDKDKNGYIHQDEFNLFVQVLHRGGDKHKEPNSNIQRTVEALDVDKDGKLTWAEFVEIHRLYPQVMFPAFRVQVSMMHAVLGWPWWKNKKNELLLLKLAVEEANERQKRKQLAMMEKQRQAAIRRDMGFLTYYTSPWDRRKYDVKYPPVTADMLTQMNEDRLQSQLGALEDKAKAERNIEEEARKRRKELEEAQKLRDDGKLTVEQATLVDKYAQSDRNFKEVQHAFTEHRRIKYKEDQDQRKNKKRKAPSRINPEEKDYQRMVLATAHAGVGVGTRSTR